MDIFATPALYSHQLDPAEWQARVSAMLNRAEHTQKYVAGAMSPDDFAEALRMHGIADPWQLDKLWEDGQQCPGII